MASATESNSPPSASTASLVVRWTVGAVSPAGYEALALSIAGARRLFGPSARYIVCVNTVAVSQARYLTGPIAAGVEWRAVTRAEIPRFVGTWLDAQLAEGTGWKFAPLRVGHCRFELALDNDCILWRMPAAIDAWLGDARSAVIAEDVRPCFGRFAPICGDAPRNSGIRGVANDVPYAAMLREVLATSPGLLSSELDEQGLQVAALTRCGEPLVVTTDEVSICSPFPPHQPRLGTCGVHFVGLNARTAPWSCGGRPATAWIQEHWERWKPSVRAMVTR